MPQKSPAFYAGIRAHSATAASHHRAGGNGTSAGRGGGIYKPSPQPRSPGRAPPRAPNMRGATTQFSGTGPKNRGQGGCVGGFAPLGRTEGNRGQGRRVGGVAGILSKRARNEKAKQILHRQLNSISILHVHSCVTSWRWIPATCAANIHDVGQLS